MNGTTDGEPKSASQFQGPQRLHAGRRTPRPHRPRSLHVVRCPLHWALIAEVSFLSPPPRPAHQAEKGWERPARNKEEGRPRSETAAAARSSRSPSPAAPSALARRVPTPRERGGRGTGRRAPGARARRPRAGRGGGAALWRVSGPLPTSRRWLALPPPQKGIVGPRTHSPPAHAEPTASRPRLRPASRRRRWRRPWVEGRRQD